ncbi:hypothetical protein M2390_001976 [Mycetocola sp. BIGb0189]|uniref:hypothetical protein n=1 Tax=Mycetocola sp. BIGb0189 TaxID=2940604 RepID=UPI002169EC03|nr:hypothetical protein [Mycetocola sp. BIGb0189]MCS4276782.1 hypothetical protein [Mycetocola sp. BIGb0189]
MNQRGSAEELAAETMRELLRQSVAESADLARQLAHERGRVAELSAELHAARVPFRRLRALARRILRRNR